MTWHDYLSLMEEESRGILLLLLLLKKQFTHYQSEDLSPKSPNAKKRTLQ